MDIFDLTGDKVRQLREKLGWTRDDLFEKSGVPARTIQDIESGNSKNPGLETIKSMLKALPSYERESTAPVRAEVILSLQQELLDLNLAQLKAVQDSIKSIRKPANLDNLKTKQEKGKKA